MTEKRMPQSGAMTAEDRADFVVDSIWDLEKRTIGDWTKAIAEQIQLAVDEARAANECSHCSGILQSYQMKYYRGCLCRCHESTYIESYEKGFSDARERAAKVVDDSDSDEQKSAISESIRALQSEEK